MTREEVLRIQSEVTAMLVEVQRFHVQDIMNKYPTGTTGEARDLRKVIWKAREAVRTSHGVVFGAVAGTEGLFERLEPDRVANQARRQRRAGDRKIQRALEKTDLAASTVKDVAQKERLSKEADRQRLRIAIEKSRVLLPGLEE